MPHLSRCLRTVCERSARHDVLICLFFFSSSSSLPSPTGSCLESQLAESPAMQVDGSDLASPMSPRASKSRMSMKLRRSSGSANKTWPKWANTHDNFLRDTPRRSRSLQNSAHCTVRDKPHPLACDSCRTPPIQSQKDQRQLKYLFFLSIADGYRIAFYLNNFHCCCRSRCHWSCPLLRVRAIIKKKKNHKNVSFWLTIVSTTTFFYICTEGVLRFLTIWRLEMCSKHVCGA